MTYNKKTKNKKDDSVIDVTEKPSKEDKKLIKVDETQAEEEFDAMAQTNKMMYWMMPIMSVSISLVAPLGLAFEA